jgi:hypothetical protein
MTLCKHYVFGKCTHDTCKFEHINNVCRSFFSTGTCNRENCKFIHEYTNKSSIPAKVKNTETFEPSFKEPDIRVRFNQPILAGNEICIVQDLFWNKNILSELLKEIPEDVLLKWHGDNHLIADDSIKWREYSPTFNTIVEYLCNYFDMKPASTRFNLYKDSSDWKPYHHDAAALKPNKAKTQNITVGVSFGLTRDISFESADSNKFNRKTINFTLQDKMLYAFGNEVNIRFRHGIPKIKEHVEYPRISIIIWGHSNYLNSD